MKKLFLTLIFLPALCIYAQQSFQLQFPVRCSMNQNCWIINYVDDDSSGNWHDYKGGRQTYNEHTGTDIAIKNISQMRQGVDVIATASGTVVATRDGIQDKNALSQDLSQLQNIACGNRVAIKTGEWITDYCHMKNGSIRVKKGDYVSTGQTIGQIGMSGLTEFPHLHISVQQGNQFFDPFTGLERYSKGYKNPLWNPSVLQQLSYKPHVIYNIGVSNEIPSLLNIRNEKYKNNQISSNSDLLLVWLDTMHVEVNDIIDVSVSNFNGIPYLKQRIVVDKANAKKMFYTGKRKPANGFVKGNYNVQIFFRRPSSDVSDFQSFKFVIY